MEISAAITRPKEPGNPRRNVDVIVFGKITIGSQTATAH
jgi:hypothetical protein